MNKKNKDLVDQLIKRKYIQTDRVKRAFLNVDRKDFLPEKKKEYRYSDTPVPIGKNQTISAPHMVAIMTEHLQLDKDSKVMEIGTGSGYQAAIIGEIVEEGEVHTAEKIKQLYEKGKKNLRNYSNIHVYLRDGTRGIPEVAPFNRIISTCGAPEIPEPWGKQLNNGGLIIVPVGGRFRQRLMRYEKINGEIIEEDLNIPCRFVPMRGKHGY